MKKVFSILSMLTLTLWATAQDTQPLGNNAEPNPAIQEEFKNAPAGYVFHEGDTIALDRNCTQFLTGEKPATWVFDVPHLIAQVGSQRFPNGVLLAGILSWVEPTCLMPTPAAVLAQAPAPAEEPAPVAKPEPIAEPEPVAAPAPVAEPEPVAKPEPVAESEPVAEPEPEVKHTQLDRFTNGVRAGGASFLQQSINEAKSQMGFDAILDLQYAHYWTTKKEHKLGLLTGASIGFAQGGLKMSNIQDEYTLIDPDGMSTHYTVTADNISELNRQIQVEVPLMFSLVSKQGIFFNFGPRFMLPVYTPNRTVFENPVIDAYLEPIQVHITNEKVTGLVDQNQLDTKAMSQNQFKLNIMLGAELGYEWSLKNGNALGLGVYADYSVYSMFKHEAQDLQYLLTVTPAVPAVVTTYAPTDAWIKKQGFVDFGIKVAYHLNWWK